MTTLDVGALVHKVTIQQAVESLGASRQPILTWSTLTTAWMSRLEKSAREQFRSEQTSSASTVVWVMRYAASMSPDVVDVAKLRRLVYQGRTYDILDARIMGRRDWIELTTLAASRVTP